MNRIKKKVGKSSTIGCIRNSIDEQAIMNQKLEILEYCRTHNLNIDKWVELEVSARKFASHGGSGELLTLSEGDTLVSTEIARLGKSTAEVLGLVNQILEKRVRIIFTRQNLDLGIVTGDKIAARIVLAIFSVLAELEKNIISLRIKETFSSKKKCGASIGKARGTIQNSIYDNKREQILLLLSKGISVFDISRIIGIGKARSLLIYLNKRKLREGRKLGSKK